MDYRKIMTKNEVIDKVREYSKIIANVFHPEQIILYGSYVRGTADVNSDIDVAVLCSSSDEDYLERSALLHQMTSEVDLRIEPILIEDKNGRSGFYKEILKTGIIVYSF